MEAVPRLPMLNIPVKTGYDSPWLTKSILKCIRSIYHEDPELYTTELHEFEVLRRSAINVSTDFTGCSSLKRYYCQLLSLMARFPLNDVEPDLKLNWVSGFDKKENSGDINYEMSCVMFNIAALHMSLGALDPRTTPAGMKISCTHFQCAAWAFQTLSQTMQEEPDLNSQLMIFFMNLALGQAQECILEKSMTDNRKPNIIAKVSMQVIEYFKLCMNALDNLNKANQHVVDKVGSKVFKLWIKYTEVKMLYYQAVTLFHQGLQTEEHPKFGERIAFYQAAVNKLEEAAKLAKSLDKIADIWKKLSSETLTFANDVIQGKLTVAEKENEFVYHEKVPPISSLPDVKGASLVKCIPFSFTDPEVSGPDIFARLVPIEAHQASSMYSEEKAKLLRRMTSQIQEKNDELETYLVSMQLDSFAVDEAMDTLPQELVECCADFNSRDAYKELTGAMSEINNSFHDIEAKLNEVKSLIQEEEAKDKEFNIITGTKAHPNQILNEIKREMSKYKEAQQTANENNQTLHSIIVQHRENIATLSEPWNVLTSKLPSVAAVEGEGDKATRHEVQRLVRKVREMQTQRADFEDQLRNNLQADDVTKELVTSQLNTEEFFQQQLQKHANIVSLLEQNMTAQMNIVQALSEANAAFASTRRAINQAKNKRADIVGSLIASYQAFTSISQKAEAAKNFFLKLEGQVTKLVTRTKSTCSVQEEQREQKLSAAAKKFTLKQPTAAASVASAAPKLKDYLAAGINPNTSSMRPNPLGCEIRPKNTQHDPSQYPNQSNAYYPPTAPSPMTGMSQSEQNSAVSSYSNTQHYSQTVNTPATITYQHPVHNIPKPLGVSSSYPSMPATSSNPTQAYSMATIPHNPPTGAGPSSYQPTTLPGYPPQFAANVPQQNPTNYQPNPSSVASPYYPRPTLPSGHTSALTEQRPDVIKGAYQPQPMRVTPQNAARFPVNLNAHAQPIGATSVPSQMYANPTYPATQVPTSLYQGYPADPKSNPNMHPYAFQKPNQYPTGITQATAPGVPTYQTPYPASTTSAGPYPPAPYSTSYKTPISSMNTPYAAYGVNPQQRWAPPTSQAPNPAQRTPLQTPYANPLQQIGTPYNTPAYIPNIQPQIPTQQIPPTPVTVAPAPKKDISNVDLLSDIDLSQGSQWSPLVPNSNNATNLTEDCTDSPSKAIQNGSSENDRTSNKALLSSLTSTSDASIMETLAQQTKRSTSVVDPLGDDDTLQGVILETERLSKFVQSLDKKSLNGPTNLELKWKELSDTLEQKCATLKVSVGRCYPLKNRFPDVLPFDETRVLLPSSRDDYINASNVQLKCVEDNFPLIVTQAPMNSTVTEFWTMVSNNQAEIIVCINTEAEVKGQTYYPKDCGSSVSYGSYSIVAKQVMDVPNQSWIQRTLHLTNNSTKMTKVILHVQFISWPPSAMPESPAQFLQYITEIHTLQKQQRNKLRPVIVHCVAGTGRSGVFVALSSFIKQLHSKGSVADLWRLVVELCQQRRSALQDRTHMLFLYSAALYYVQDILMKRGILTDKATFGDTRREKTHVRHPSADLLSSDLNRIKLNLGLDQDQSCNLTRSGSQSSVASSASAKNPTALKDLWDDVPVTDCNSSVASPAHSRSRTESPRTHQIGGITLPPNLAAIIDSDQLVLETPDPQKLAKITKDSFSVPSKGFVSDPHDPFGSLDPLWNINKD